MKHMVGFAAVILLLQGCASTKTMDIMIDEKITAPRIVAMSGSRGPWVYEIEKRLKNMGFDIKRMPSQNTSMEQVSDTKTDIYREASTRFILHIDGYAPNTKMDRCYGGGYRFSYINVELIDVVKNETVFHYSNSGYSEKCPPMSGTIFGDIANMTNSVWQ